MESSVVHLLLSPLAFGDVLNLQDQMQGFAAVAASYRRTLQHPDGMAGPVQVSLLALIDFSLAFQQLIHVDQVVAQIVRIGHLLKVRRQQLLFVVTKDLAERSIHPAPLSLRRDKGHARRIIEGVTEMFLALLQRLADTRLFVSVVLCVLYIPTIGAIGSINYSDDRQRDKKSIKTEACDESRDHTGSRCSCVVGNRGPKKMFLPNLDEWPVSLHRFAQRRQAGIGDILHRGHQKERDDKVAAKAATRHISDRSKTEPEHPGGDEGGARQQGRVEQSRAPLGRKAHRGTKRFGGCDKHGGFTTVQNQNQEDECVRDRYFRFDVRDLNANSRAKDQ